MRKIPSSVASTPTAANDEANASTAASPRDVSSTNVAPMIPSPTAANGGEFSPRGVDPVELARRANRQARHGRLAPAALARWLVDAGFAVRRDGLLFPTELGAEVGSELRAIGRWG